MKIEWKDGLEISVRIDCGAALISAALEEGPAKLTAEKSPPHGIPMFL